MKRLRSKSMRFIFLLLTSLFISASYAQDQGYFLAKSALHLVNPQVEYDPSYYTLDYPNGDVPPHKGVCTDVIIRAYRLEGVDLQRLVHEDMAVNFSAYPSNWGLTRPDRNIDHRRVPNLMTFFTRAGAKQPFSENPSDYKPGDVVCWELTSGQLHIGLVVAKKGRSVELLHNLGYGQVVEACLFDYPIIGHYRYWP